MPSAKPSPHTWLLAIGYGIVAYAVHQSGVILGYYPRFFWFQLVTHFLSASAMALLLVVVGRRLGLPPVWLVAFVFAFSAVGAVGWELVEYLGVFPALNWWGIEDSLLDLAVDAVGVGTILALFRPRPRRDASPGPSAGPTTDDSPVRPGYNRGD